MPALAIKKNTWDGASDRDKDVFKSMMYWLRLGHPAVFTDSGGLTEWYVWDDARFEPRPMCYFACLAINQVSFPADYTTTDKSRRQIREDAMTWLEGQYSGTDRGLKLPGQISPQPETWQALFDAQGTVPSWLLIANEVPGTWTPVGSE